ncbi:MAG: hypothetical protein PHE20_02080 [Patescibacteria group bacterium]|nr:hypothetical protein [Patescibacteria group bacterium]
MIKKIIVPILVLGIFSLILVSYTQGQTKSYYSGDATVFQNKLYIATANTGSLELFVLNNQQIDRIAKIRPFDERFGKYGNFYDLALRAEDGHLYVYAVTNFSIYKYQLNNESQLSLVKTVRNSYWEWYNRVGEIGGQLASISANNVKIWSKDMQVINEYEFSNSEVPYNVRGNDKYLLNVQNNHIYIYDRASRLVIKEIPINLKTSRSAHQIFLDNNNDIYIVDDYYAKKFNLDGKLLASFKHQDYEGYDMSASGYSQAVYFSNGIGVVKLNKDSFKLEDWAYTGGIAGPRGWAMGMKVVSLNGDKVVVFNNSNILVLNDKLDKIAAVASTEEDDAVAITENLYLNLDKNRAAPNAEVYLSGGGFSPNEALQYDLAGSKNLFKADLRGRFNQKIIVPSASTGLYDIKVTGASSGLHYSIAFQIE